MGAGGSSKVDGDKSSSGGDKASSSRKHATNPDAERQAVVEEVLELYKGDNSGVNLKALATSLRSNRHPPPDPLLVQSLDENICKRVYDACSNANREKLLQLVEKHGDKYAHAKLFYAEGLSPLMLASQKPHIENLEVITALLEKNVDPDQRNDFQSTALHYAAALQASAMPLVLLLEAGADPDPRNQVQASPAVLLLGNRLLDLRQQRSAMMLLKMNGMELNKPDYDGNSLVFHANLRSTGGLHAVLAADPAHADAAQTLTMGDKTVRKDVLKAIMDCSPAQLNLAIDGVDSSRLDGQSIVFYTDCETNWLSQAAHRNKLDWKKDLVRTLHILAETHPHFDIDRSVGHASTSTLMQYILECCVDPQYTPLFKNPIEAQLIEVLVKAGASPSLRRHDGLTPLLVGLICRPSEEDLEDDAQKVATRELCFNTIHKSISTRYKFVLLTKMIDTGQSAHDLAATMIKLANVDGQLMVDTPWGVRPHPKEAVQVYNQLYRQGVTDDDDWMMRRARLDKKLLSTIATKMLLPLLQLVCTNELTGDAFQCYEYLLCNDIGPFMMAEAAEEVEEAREVALSRIQEELDILRDDIAANADTQHFRPDPDRPKRKPTPLGSLRAPVPPAPIPDTGPLTHQIEALRFPIKGKGTFAKATIPTPLDFVRTLDASAAVEACLSVCGITPLRYVAWLERAPATGARFDYFWTQIMGFFVKGLGAMGDTALRAGLEPRLKAVTMTATSLGSTEVETKTVGQDMGSDADIDAMSEHASAIDTEDQLTGGDDTYSNINKDDIHDSDEEDIDDADADAIADVQHESEVELDDDSTRHATSNEAEDVAPRLVVWSPIDHANALWRIQHDKRQHRDATVKLFDSPLVHSYTRWRGVSSEAPVTEPFHPFEQGGNLSISRAVVIADSDEQLLRDREMLVGLNMEQDGMQIVGETNSFLSTSSGPPCITFHLLVRLPHPRFKHVICELMLTRREVFEVLDRVRPVHRCLQTLQRQLEASRKLPKSLKVRYKPQQAVRLSR